MRLVVSLVTLLATVLPPVARADLSLNNFGFALVVGTNDIDEDWVHRQLADSLESRSSNNNGVDTGNDSSDPLVPDSELGAGNPIEMISFSEVTQDDQPEIMGFEITWDAGLMMFAFEYTQYSEISLTYQETNRNGEVVSSASGDINASSYKLSLAKDIPLGSRWSVIPETGLYILDSQVRFTSNGTTHKRDNTENSLLIGSTLKAKLAKQFYGGLYFQYLATEYAQSSIGLKLGWNLNNE